MKLNAEQKCDIATRELEELREEIERMKEESDKILDNYKVTLFKKTTKYLHYEELQLPQNDLIPGGIKCHIIGKVCPKLLT